MKLQPGIIITIFMIIMLSFMVFLNSQARTILERESNFDSIHNDEIFLAYSTLLQDLESKITILRKDNDDLHIFDESDGSLISIDSNDETLLVQTSSVIQLYNLKKLDEKESPVPTEIALTNIQSLIPFDLRTEFPLPTIELVKFNPNNPEELLLIISQISENNAKYCFIKRTKQGKYEITDIPTLTVNVKVDGLLKTSIASLQKNEVMLISSYFRGETSKLIAYFTDGQNWQKIQGINETNVDYFDVDTLKNQRIDILAQNQDLFTFTSIEKQNTKNAKTKSDFSERYSIKTRPAKLQNEVKSTFSMSSDDKNQYLFFNKEGSIKQARLINWEKGAFSQTKNLKINVPSTKMPELTEIWYVILTMLAGFVFIIVFAIMKRKKGIKQMLNPVEFLDDGKTQKATEKEETKQITAETDKRLKLLGRNDVERPQKEEIPDLGDPFSIYEHFGYLPAGLLIRTLSSGLDLVFLAPVFYWLGGTLGIRIDDLFSGPDWFLAHLLIMFVHFVYFVGFEYYLGKTLGKMITGIRTVTVENKTMKIWQVVVRNLTRIPDYYLFFVMMFNMRAQRIGDLITKTVVIFDPKDKELS